MKAFVLLDACIRAASDQTPVTMFAWFKPCINSLAWPTWIVDTVAHQAWLTGMQVPVGGGDQHGHFAGGWMGRCSKQTDGCDSRCGSGFVSKAKLQHQVCCCWRGDPCRREEGRVDIQVAVGCAIDCRQQCDIACWQVHLQHETLALVRIVRIWWFWSSCRCQLHGGQAEGGDQVTGSPQNSQSA